MVALHRVQRLAIVVAAAYANLTHTVDAEHNGVYARRLSGLSQLIFELQALLELARLLERFLQDQSIQLV